MTTKKFMRAIIVTKLAVALLVLGIYQGWIQIGDAHIFAGEEPKQDDASKTKDGEDSKTSSSKEKETSEKKDDDSASGKARKSFLSELFELPKLDSKNARKEEIGKYLDMADRKEKQIKNRESLLAKREEQLKAIERSIDEKLVKLDEERKFIAKTLQEEKDLKGERLEKLVALYDKMEPKKAAPQIEKLDKDLVVGLFKGLKQKQVTTILEAMSPDKSVEITEYFGRVKSGREYDLLKELNSSLKKEFADCKGLGENSKEIVTSKSEKTTPEKNAQKPQMDANPKNPSTPDKAADATAH